MQMITGLLILAAIALVMVGAFFMVLGLLGHTVVSSARDATGRVVQQSSTRHRNGPEVLRGAKYLLLSLVCAVLALVSSHL